MTLKEDRWCKILRQIGEFCALIALIMAGLACDPPSPELRSTPLDYGSPRPEQAGEVVMGEENDDMILEDLTQGVDDWPQVQGLWTITHHKTQRSELPVILEEIETTIDTVLVGELTQDRDELWFHYLVCDVFMKNTPGFNQTILPDAFIDALPYQTRSARLIKEGDRFFFSIPPQYELRGLSMRDPINEAFPDTDSDVRIYDQDRDASPGMSARLVGFPEGEVSLIQRSWESWRGEVNIEARSRVESIKGEIEWGDEQRIIAATNEVLRVDVRRWIPQESGLHYFEMRRVEALECPPRRPPPSPDQ